MKNNKKKYTDNDLINILKDLSDEISKLQSLTALDQILKEKEFPRLNTFKRRLKIKNIEELRVLLQIEAPILQEKISKVNFNRGGNGGESAKLTLPATWFRQMGLNDDDRNIKVIFLEKESKIIIEKNK